MKQNLTMEQAERTAARILELTRRRLAQEIPALMLPLYLFHDQPLTLPIPPSTDGCHLFYCPQRLIADFRADQNLPARQLVHVVLHCLLGHLPQRQGVSRTDLFDALADCRVQDVMDHLLLRLRLPRDPSEEDFFSFFSEDLLEEELELSRPMPELYRTVRQDREKMPSALKKGADCALDCHKLWNSGALQISAAREDQGDGEGKEQVPSQKSALPAPDWKAVRDRLMDAHSDEWGTLPGALREAFCPTEENFITYRDFLRRFAAPGERLLTDYDSLDYRWYCLGLELYGDIPLVEPPELSEPPIPDQLVIALDTSGSCSGDVVRRFLRETMNLLRDISAGAGRFQVLLLQCDARIQKERMLQSPDQVDTLMEDFVPRGFGGTDFCPVFQRVEQLRKEGTLSKVRGLLYLSDGLGLFPDNPPDYPAVFLIPRENGRQPRLPSWLTALYLDPNEFTVKEASV